jgi:hypothetical protein
MLFIELLYTLFYNINSGDVWGIEYPKENQVKTIGDREAKKLNLF